MTTAYLLPKTIRACASVQRARIMAFVMATLTIVTSAAQTPWNGTADQPLTGNGESWATAIEISTAEQLHYIALHPKDYAGKYLVQTADIDLGGTFDADGRPNGQLWIPIGNYMYGIFAGHYDGQGHTISNMHIDWWAEITNTARWTSAGTCESSGVGLFGAFGGTVKNLIIDGAYIANLTHHSGAAAQNTIANSRALKIGVLAGIVSRWDASLSGGATLPTGVTMPTAVKMENIIVRNSHINSHNTRDNANDWIRSIMIGGLIGDINSNNINGANNITDGQFTVRNAYLGVDVDFDNTGRGSNVGTNQETQYNIGGVVGRIRKGVATTVPSNVFFEGKIKAPLAAIGPVYSMTRTNASATFAAGFLPAYIGEPMSGTASVIPDDGKYFGNYQIWHAADGEYKTITNSYPSKSNTYGNSGIRTFAKPDATDFVRTDPAQMMKLQGVNKGIYVNDANTLTKKADVLMKFNEYSQNNDLLLWMMPFGFSTIKTFSMSQTSRNTFRMDVGDADLTGYTLKWEGRRTTNGEWCTFTNGANVSGANTTTLTCNNSYAYSAIRVTLTKDGKVLQASCLVAQPSLTLVTDGDNYTATPDNMFAGENYHVHWQLYVVDPANNANNRWEDYAGNDHTNYVANGMPQTCNASGAVAVLAELRYDDDTPVIQVDGKPLRKVATNYQINIKKFDDPAGLNGFRYVVGAYDPDGNLMAGSAGVEGDTINLASTQWLWEVSSDPGNRSSWEGVDFTAEWPRRCWIAPFNADRWYRVSWIVNGITVKEDVYGPTNVIFVYDREKTQVGIEKGFTTFDGYDSTNGMPYDDGNDQNTGYGPYHAVKTMKRAYELVDADRGMNENIIVVMGLYYDKDFMRFNHIEAGEYRKPVTIVGAYNEQISGGAISMLSSGGSGGGLAGYPEYDLTLGLGGATTFRDITWVGDNTLYPSVKHPTTNAMTNTICAANSLSLYCNLHDLVIDRGVRIMGYRDMTDINGQLTTNCPDITIVGGIHNKKTTDPLVYSPWNATEGVTTMTFKSGNFARIIAGARNNEGNTAGTNPSRNVFGSPENPHRVRVKVQFIHTERGILDYADKPYDYDINLLVGGQTDGTVYSEAELNVTSGSIGRFISGSISYGRNIPLAPDDTYFGSTTLNLKGGSIAELYGGSLGRTEGGAECTAYFYGRSVINVDGGDITSDIYAAGAGGVTGVGRCEHIDEAHHDKHHTTDKFIPYYNASHKLTYGNYEAVVAGSSRDEYNLPTFDNMPVMQLMLPRTANEGFIANYEPETLRLSDSSVGVNIYSGTLLGNIYGGGYGYSSAVTYDRALDLSGVVFGETFVNIEQLHAKAPEIYGNVYGGGNGSDQFFMEEACKKYYTSRNDHYQSDAGGKRTAAAARTLALRDLGIYVDKHRDELLRMTPFEDEGVSITADDIEAAYKKFGKLARLFGSTSVTIRGGYIDGDVFAGARGIAAFRDMATVYGNTNLTIEEGTDETGKVTIPEINGNIYGGCDFANVLHSDLDTNGKVTGNTNVTINGGIIGNCVFGGSKGAIAEDGDIESVTEIDGDTKVRVTGGSFVLSPYINRRDNSDGYRSFNIYGGGNKKCRVKGTAHLDIHSSLLYTTNQGMNVGEHPFMQIGENPNEDEDYNSTPFQAAYMDYTYRRFAIYGGGYGVKTNCLNTDVYVTIPKIFPWGQSSNINHGNTLARPYDHQSFFDIAGGGYSGDIGYWAMNDTIWNDNANHNLGYNRIRVLPVSEIVDSLGRTATPEDYQFYVGGDCRMVIDGNTYCRKVIGGGFYGSCNNTFTHIRCGSLRQVYGGSLLGYVHSQAKIDFGNRMEDFLPEGATHTAADSTAAYAAAKALNDYIYITQNIYGGNDVKGIVGTAKWRATDGSYGADSADGGPLWMTNIDADESKGVVFNIYGGRFMGDVYGAGNGHYRGYYVPGWLRYEDGPDRMYRIVRGTDGTTLEQAQDAINNDDSLTPDEKETQLQQALINHRVYRSRPMVGSVNINIRGNRVRYMPSNPTKIDEANSDYVKIDGNFYGGGSECTIGQWRTILPFEDPRRLAAGGHLHVNIGGCVTIGFRDAVSTYQTLYPGHSYGNMYMGVEGELYSGQPVLSRPLSAATYNPTTKNLASLGDAAYAHWWFNPVTNRYELGFPALDKVDGNFGMNSGHMLRGYMKNIEMQGDVELTFYRDIYTDPNDVHTRKHWIPGELAIDKYNAKDIVMNSFFLGGKCGSMTNNNLMAYCYTTGRSIDLNDPDNLEPGHKHEPFGAIYRITMPQSVSIKDKIVMGSEDATVRLYPYNADFTAIDETYPDPYVYEGGLITQAAYSFDYIAYNDYMAQKYRAQNKEWPYTVTLPADFYKDEPDEGTDPADFAKYQEIKAAQTWLVQRTQVNIKRHKYASNVEGLNTKFGINKDKSIADDMYAMAVTDDNVAYVGRRASRTLDGNDRQTVTKLTTDNTFLPQVGDKSIVPPTGEHSDNDDLDYLYGGIIYGGCYNSGNVVGDIIINAAGNMMGNLIKQDDYDRWFGHLSGLGHYIGRVYGGGYGKDTHVDGDVYINLLRHFQGMNVFGGGMQGDVNGDVNINYVGANDSYVYGAIYGGGFQGNVGRRYYRLNDDRLKAGGTISKTEFDALNHSLVLKSIADYEAMTDEQKQDYHLYVPNGGTRLNLISGNVDHVYGGSCMGNVYGATTIDLHDEVTDSLSHLDYEQVVSLASIEDWGTARLVAGTVFGGNDISGNIFHTDNTYQGLQPKTNDTNVLLREEQYVAASGNGLPANGSGTGARRRNNTSTPANARAEAPGKDTPGSQNGYNGFPLVGNLYGGSNGDYGISRGTTGYLMGSTISFATGVRNYIRSLDLGDINNTGDAATATAMPIPHVDRSSIRITGGTVVNAYGGGDNASVIESDSITVAYNNDNLEVRAGFTDPYDLQRIWNVCHINSDLQIDEVMQDTVVVKTDSEGNPVLGPDNKPVTVDGKIFRYQIFRLFGGNDHADMSLQPSWKLRQGYLGSIYSGANFGRMTHYDPNPEGDLGKGLNLAIDAPRLHANAVYGGGRVGDIAPDVPESATSDPDLYGATLIIRNGVIDHVYGGNDVSGEVNHGTRVAIYGSISGDVYCAGNGNYLYQYDPNDTSGVIGEHYHKDTGERIFTLPRKDGYYNDNMSNALKVMAINSYRPNVSRSKLTIEGKQDGAEVIPAYVHGSVYMGGNSATVHAGKSDDVFDDIVFELGSNVVVNRIHMGSNGEQLVTRRMMDRTEVLNQFDLSAPNSLTPAERLDLEAAIGTSDVMKNSLLGCFDTTLYPTLLDLYMRGVEVEGLPKNFALSPTIENALVGDFFVGGNCGSMTTRETIDLEFPQNITIFGKIVGGSNNASITYKGVTHEGGLTRKLDEGTTKVKMSVYSKFLPMRIVYPSGNWWEARIEDDLTDMKGEYVKRHTNGNVYYFADDGSIDFSRPYDGTKTVLSNNRCNIYGGCFNSGKTVGDIKIDLYSDMLLYGNGNGEADYIELTGDAAQKALNNRRKTIVNGIDSLSRRTCSVIGGGYGSATSVWGDINIRLLPQVDNGNIIQHPSCGALFGGSQEGLVVGNTTVEVRDGLVFANLYGSSESSYMYGSTQILVGYPKHYKCLKSGRYMLDRADKYSSQHDKMNDDSNIAEERTEVVKHSVWYRKGDIVANNIFERIKAYDTANGTNQASFTTDHDDESVNFLLCDEDTPDVFGTTWNDININIGDPTSRNARTAADIESAPYYSHGNIYGGGFVSNNALMSLAGQRTLKHFRTGLMPDAIKDDPNATKYGGNSSIMIWDNPSNASEGTWDEATRTYSSMADGTMVRDHVSIGTAKFVRKKMKVGDDKMGLFYVDPIKGVVHQPSGIYTDAEAALNGGTGKTFYTMEADGGIYGGGRKVFVEGLSTCDLAYYGYADYTPQMPKLINSLQRLDQVDITDCCLQLQGSNDFVSSNAGSKYSLTRVGELRMNSSLAVNADGTPRDIALDEGEADDENQGNTLHVKPRSRNCLAFFHSVKFLGALVSNVDFDRNYHDKDGALDNSIDYKTKKRNIIDTFYASDKQNDALTAFKQRNVATSVNMVGINNGYQLKIQGTRTSRSGDNTQEVDQIYYGPAIGVTEVKLLTMAVGEGGGYVYALNKHDEEGDEPNTTTPHFLQTLGNFVFPGAAFGGTEDAPTMNYIIDDCFPIGHGYDAYIDEGKTNVNKAQEIHYWYVNGQRYFFNATLTAYTSNEHKDPYFLDNTDNLMMLAGITKNSENIRIKSVKWDVPDDEDDSGYTYDLTRTSGTDQDGKNITSLADLPYNIYLTIDENTSSNLTTASPASEFNGAWMTDITRTDYTAGSGTVPANKGSYGDKQKKTGAVNPNTGAAIYAPFANTPLLGIKLTDDVKNNDKDYYAAHLERPGMVKIVVACTNEDGLDYEYTLNLSIVYLRGSAVHGNIMIENCALPGEMIYANAFGVVSEGDDATMGVTSRRWVMYKTQMVNSVEESIKDVDITDVCKVDEGNDMRIAIPACYWMNGWKLAYIVTINGIDKRLTVRADDDRLQELTVHNYHRMLPWNYTSYKDAAHTIRDYSDLQLTAGARVYIDNVEDLEEFLKYMNLRVQDSVIDDDDTSPNYGKLLPSHRGYIARGANTLYLPSDYDDHVVVDPQYAADMHFVLRSDLKIPDGTPANTYGFAATFSGNGHTIDMNDCTQFMGAMKKVVDDDGNIVSMGRMYNTGFYSHHSNTTIIGENHGRMLGCFYYNDAVDTHGKRLPPSTGTNDATNGWQNRRGRFVGNYASLDVEGNDNDIQYCYQNANTSRRDNYGNSIYYNDEDFETGRVAYDLNVLYLNERYKRNTGNEGMSNVNNSSYVYKYYHDGSYRFADYDPTHYGTGAALRTERYPNYNDHYSEGLIPVSEMNGITAEKAALYGKASTYHNCHPKVDDDRYMPDEDYYQPHYPVDFMFFGQDLSATNLYQKYPTTLDKVMRKNRVYRASGFYGTQEDRGFHFNMQCVARHKQLTAIDFTGERARERMQWYIDMKARYGERVDQMLGEYPESEFALGKFEWPINYTNPDGSFVRDADNQFIPIPRGQHKQSVFFPPVLDLPSATLGSPTTNPAEMHLESFTVLGNATINDTTRVTKNLLVYAHEDADQDVLLPLMYTEDMNAVSDLSATRHYARASHGMEHVPVYVAPHQLPVQSDDQDRLCGHLILYTQHGMSRDVEGVPVYHYETANGLFHLVDKQNLNVPIDFQVGQRAWYYRLPTCFSNGNNAWEGICLPFTVNRVLATDYTGDAHAMSNRNHGEVSHFYGPEMGTDSDQGENILHEYWLRSLTGWHNDNGDVVLEFTRPDYAPSSDAETLHYRHVIYDAVGNETTPAVADDEITPLQRVNYHYSNKFFSEAYGGTEATAYQESHTAPQYTETGRDFSSYPLLTSRLPYIVSFPGRRYYEFDMSGVFYKEHLSSEPTNYPQIITYENLVGAPNIVAEVRGNDGNAHLHNDADYTPVLIRATHEAQPYVLYGGDASSRYTLAGTYQWRTLGTDDYGIALPSAADAQALIASNDYSDEARATKPDGSYFDSSAALVAPFRVYLTGAVSGGARRAYIGSPLNEEENTLPELDSPDDETIDESLSELRVYVVDGKLHIDSPVEGILPLHTISGIHYRQLRVHAGTTIYPDLPRGCYIVHRKKVLLR